MQLLESLKLEVAAVKGELLETSHVFQGSYEYCSIWQAEIIMSELDLLNANICSKTFAKHA